MRNKLYFIKKCLSFVVEKKALTKEVNFIKIIYIKRQVYFIQNFILKFKTSMNVLRWEAIYIYLKYVYAKYFIFFLFYMEETFKNA